MYKVGILMIIRPQSHDNKIKEIVLQVQAKTRIKNLVEYLLELDKLTHSNVYISLQKKGRPLGEDTTISQVLKLTKPQKGIIKMFLYQKNEEDSVDRLDIKRGRGLNNSSSIIISEKGKSSLRESKNGEEQKKCCCF